MQGDTMKTLTTILVAMLLMLVYLPVRAELESLPGDVNMPVGKKQFELLSGLCESCHGPGGVSQREDVPGLAGRPAEELMGEIERFYFYERHCPDVPLDPADRQEGNMSMCDVTGQMNKAEAMALARYFESGVVPSAKP